MQRSRQAPGHSGVQIVFVVQLVTHVKLFNHVHQDDAVEVRLLANIVDSRRNMILDLCQQLLGRGSWIAVELTIEYFVVHAFGVGCIAVLTTFRLPLFQCCCLLHGFPHKSLSRRACVIVPDGILTRMSQTDPYRSDLERLEMLRARCMRKSSFFCGLSVISNSFIISTEIVR